MEFIHVGGKRRSGKVCLKNKKILMVFFLLCLPRLYMAMGIAASVTKDPRVEGGASISSSVKASISTPPHHPEDAWGACGEASHKAKARAGNSAADAQANKTV